jgi:hypothetical protein
MNAASLRAGLEKHALWLGLAWGFLEGCVFFVIPDLLISLVALFSFRRSLQCLGAVLAGSLLAGAVMYLFSAQAPGAAHAVVAAVPLVQASMFDKVRDGYASLGVIAPLKGPMSGIPYKVYAVTAPKYLSLGVFLLISVPARLERLLISWAAFSCAGFLLRHKREQYSRRMMIGHALYWLAAYAYYVWVVTHG